MIRVDGLGKKYVLGKNQQSGRYTALRDVLAETVKSQWRRWGRKPRAAEEDEEFWALRDVSFKVRRGEVVGIIGRNGAGKSTLLKVLSRITEPTAGRITLKGRVASLLEVGTGFHPELTGRENIYLNGAILGMQRAEIKAKFDEIVDFSEVERFLDTPVKRYSSGMYVRLAFAVAAHLEPEILIVDEVLAVGDAEFQKKCLGKMQSVARGEGKTVIFVSHNIQALRTLCSRAVLLRAGNLIGEGDVAACIASYSATGGERGNEEWIRREMNVARNSAQTLVFERIHATLRGMQPAPHLILDVDLRSRGEHKRAFLAVDILDAGGMTIMQALPQAEKLIAWEQIAHRLKVIVALPPLIPGRYFVTTWVGSHNTETLDEVRSAVAFEIDVSPVPGRSFPHSPDHGYIVPLSTIEERGNVPEIAVELPAKDSAVAFPT